MNRPVIITQPNNHAVVNKYNKGGLLEKVQKGHSYYISNINYNARGQRTEIYFGNNSKTAYTYDDENFRLTRLLTTKNTGSVILQDLNYSYDSVGNITEVEDDAQQTVYFDNSVIDPISTYEYDALYRLIEATGREKGGLNSAPTHADLAIVTSVPFNNQSNDVSNYTQTFEYDKLGNIVNMSSQNKWSRDYFYDTATNRLLKHDEYGQNEYTYDTHGNMLTMPGISEMNWDFGDKLNKTISGTVTSYYNYDSGGERTRKVVLKQGGIREERYYISGYEVYRKFISDVIDTERQTLHIADDRKRFAIIDTLTVENGVTLGTLDVTIRYQYDNHLGSASLELDESANVISYEEYHPFGTSSYRLGTNEAEVQLKRYRYVGKERDEETGLYYYGARYYATWLCRFVSVDPLQHEYPFSAPYNYAGNNPVTLNDINGEAPGNGPDKFVVNPGKANCSEVLGDGTAVTYVSGNSADIEMYQQMFEESGGLDFENRGQINSYFKSVYGVEPYGWAPRGEFGSESNRGKVIAAFEEAGSLYGISPSLLYTYAAGEGLILLTGYDIENNVPINSFNLLGLDFFGSEWHKYNLPSYFKSGGNTALGETPNFGTATHTTITQADGSPLIRNEAGGATKISPVYFKNFNIAIIGASGVYAAAYNKSVTSGQNQGWGELNENEKAFFGYYSIQYPNRELSYYGNASGNFLDNSIRYDLTSTDPSDVPSKAYRRWVEWRYVKISGFFSK